MAKDKYVTLMKDGAVMNGGGENEPSSKWENVKFDDTEDTIKYRTIVLFVANNVKETTIKVMGSSGGDAEAIYTLKNPYYQAS